VPLIVFSKFHFIGKDFRELYSEKLHRRSGIITLSRLNRRIVSSFHRRSRRLGEREIVPLIVFSKFHFIGNDFRKLHSEYVHQMNFAVARNRKETGDWRGFRSSKRVSKQVRV
jgi:hypothetical protein